VAWPWLTLVRHQAQGDSANEIQANALFLVNFLIEHTTNSRERNKKRVALIMSGIEQTIGSIEEKVP